MLVKNPLFHIDMPDPDVIRVGDTYYMVSTTMFYMPTAPILKSKDLVNWEIASYICNEVADNEIYRLENEMHAYGKGQWATSLMEYKGRFYACFVCHDLKETFLFSTDDIEKSDWDRVALGAVYHDMSFLCWEDRVYLVYGNQEIRIVELKEDFSGVVEGSDQLLFKTPTEGMRLYCEGCRAYVKDGYIYLLFIDWPADTEEAPGMRREVCYRSKALFGPYESKVILYDNMHQAGAGVAQGVMISDVNDNWYAMMFSDCGGAGRIPFLMPMKWEEGWPVLGVDGKVPDTFEIPLEEVKTKALIQNDDFCYEKNELKNVWEWNHVPDNTAWSVTERPGYLRLHNRTMADDLMNARNTLTQKTKAPYSEFTVCLECDGMKNGDYAGLCVLMEKCGQIGVMQKNGKRSIVMQRRSGKRAEFDFAWSEGPIKLKRWYPLKKQEEAFEQNKVWLRVAFHFDIWNQENERAEFFYSLDGKQFVKLGDDLEMFFSLSMFVGARVGIFSYNDETEQGGYADFAAFTFGETER